MSEYIKKEDIIKVMDNSYKNVDGFTETYAALLELPTIDGKSDLEVIKEYCEEKRCNDCVFEPSEEDDYCRIHFIVEDLDTAPRYWMFNAIKEAVKKIKEAK